MDSVYMPEKLGYEYTAYEVLSKEIAAWQK